MWTRGKKVEKLEFVRGSALENHCKTRVITRVDLLGEFTISVKQDKTRLETLKVKAGVNVKAEHGLSANISVTFQATLNLSAYLINHCFAVL